MVRSGGVLDHEACIERLPWYAAGSLEPDEAAQVEDHLAGCAACRRELAATRAASRLFAEEHPTSRSLVALAWGDLDERAATEIERHAAVCPECREELALAGAARGLETAAVDPRLWPIAAHPAARSTASWWPAAAAAAAGLALVVGSLALWRESRARSDLDRLGARLSEAESVAAASLAARAEAAQARQALTALESRVESLLLPQAGLVVVELLPDLTLRGRGETAPAAVERGRGPVVALLLALEQPEAHGSYSVRLRGDGGELWSVRGVAPDGSGALSLLVPMALLPDGTIHIDVVGEGVGGAVPLPSYRLRVRSAAP